VPRETTDATAGPKSLCENSKFDPSAAELFAEKEHRVFAFRAIVKEEADPSGERRLLDDNWSASPQSLKAL